MRTHEDTLKTILGYIPSDEAMEEPLYNQQYDPVSPESDEEWKDWRNLLSRGEVLRVGAQLAQALLDVSMSHDDNADAAACMDERGVAIEEKKKAIYFRGAAWGVLSMMGLVKSTKERSEWEEFPWATWNALARKP